MMNCFRFFALILIITVFFEWRFLMSQENVSVAENDTFTDNLHQQHISGTAFAVQICTSYLTALVLAYFFVKLVQNLIENAGTKSKLDFKDDSSVLIPNRETKYIEKWITEQSQLQLKVPLKISKEKTGKGWKRNSNAFNDSAFDHLFDFRRNMPARQMYTVFPATLSLVSHFTSGTYSHPDASPNFQKEGVRLASFKNFPATVPVSAMRLAQAGFYYTGERDLVKCFSCGVAHQNWQMGERPNLVHARLAPNCPLVRGSDTTNLPLPLPVTTRPNFSETASMESGYASYPCAVSKGGGAEMQVDSVMDGTPSSLGIPSSGPAALDASSSTRINSFVAEAALSGPILSSPATSENSMFSGAPLFGVATPMDSGAPRNQTMPSKRLDLGCAVYPLYSQMDARKRSFSNWVQGQGLPSIEELTTLGFFYAGYADCVRCFFCGIGLKSWEPGDGPAEVHAKWRPTCEYLRLVKGDVFVDDVANGHLNAVGRGNDGHGLAHQAIDAARNDTVSNPSNISSQQNSAPVSTQVPDIPVVRQARETGYSDQQIAEGIEKLRTIGMERAIDVMLVEVLTNLFRDNVPQLQPQRHDSASIQPGHHADDNSQDSISCAGTTSGPSTSGSGQDLQQDGVTPEEVPDNALGQPNREDRPLQQRQQLLQQENDRLRSMRTCQNCHEQPVGVIFLPCGHIIACINCAPSIRRCLRCDTVIRATANVYFS